MVCSGSLTQFVGIPWKDVEQPSFEGCDCYGLVQLYYLDVMEITLPPVEEVQQMAGRGHWQAVNGAYWPGDIALFRTAEAERHVGVLITSRHMLHVEEGCDSRIELLKGLKWKERLIKVYRYLP